MANKPSDQTPTMPNLSAFDLAPYRERYRLPGLQA